MIEERKLAQAARFVETAASLRVLSEHAQDRTPRPRGRPHQQQVCDCALICMRRQRAKPQPLLQGIDAARGLVPAEPVLERYRIADLVGQRLEVGCLRRGHRLAGGKSGAGLEVELLGSLLVCLVLLWHPNIGLSPP